MSLNKFKHNFKGYGIHKSVCVVKMLVDVQGNTNILFVDVNIGTSVTNASEQLATEIVEKYNLNPEKCKFYETYSQYGYESIDEIKYQWIHYGSSYGDYWSASNPKWKPADIKLLEQFEIYT